VSTLVTVDAMLDEHVCVSITWRGTHGPPGLASVWRALAT
jgi:hypothetical protein